MAVLSAEGDLFDIMSGRYSRDGQVPNLGIFLKGHAGDLLLVDRKGREPERIDKPALTIVVTIQPQVLLDIARRPVLRGRGLLARVLYCLPPDTWASAGSRSPRCRMTCGRNPQARSRRSR